MQRKNLEIDNFAKGKNISHLQAKGDKKIFIFCNCMIKNIIGTDMLRDIPLR